MGAPNWMFQTDLPDDIISNSLRFDDGDNARLSKTLSSAGNRKIYTISWWMKRANTGENTVLSAPINSSTNGFSIYFPSDKMEIFEYKDTGQSAYWKFTTDMVFRDTTNWYHCVFYWQTDTYSSDADSIRLYVNGSQVTGSFTGSVGADYESLCWNNTYTHYIGGNRASSSNFDGYLAEFNFVDGQALTPTSFGREVNGVWIPKDTSGLTFGTNGYRLQFKQTGTGTASASTIGADTANTNHFTPTNLAAGDVVIDTPENNFCTINNLYDLPSGWTFSEGNLKYTTTTNQRGFVCNQNIPLGNRVYWETRVESFGASDDEVYIGVAAEGITSGNLDENRGGAAVNDALVYAHSNYDNNVHLNSSSAAGTGPGQYRNSALPTVVGCAVDRVNHTIKWNLDGGDFSSEFTIPSTKDLYPFVGSGGGTGSAVGILNFGQDDTFAGAVSSNSVTGGGGKFRYAPPAGYMALCSRNLNEPAFSANPNRPENADDNFTTHLYTANNQTAQTITGVGMQPDFLWFKQRSRVDSNALYNTSMGIDISMRTTTDGEFDDSNSVTGVTAVGADGFTLGTDAQAWVNYGTDTMVSWLWKANGGTTTTNDASVTGVGTIDSTYQANTDAGFSIVTYTGTGSAGTLAHGLGAVPKFIIIKNRESTQNWVVYHASNTSEPATDNLYLNLTNATDDEVGMFNDTAPTSTVFSIGTNANVNNNTEGHLAYVFSEVEGFSKFGTYTGNGNADGTYVHLGFKPALFVAKSTGTEAWIVMDNARPGYNPTGNYLYWNHTNAEGGAGGEYIDLLSNGVKLRTTGASANGSATFVYMAWAEAPFKYSNAA